MGQSSTKNHLGLQPISSFQKGIIGPFFVLRLKNFFKKFNLSDRQSVRQDFLAGLTGAVVVLPQGVAFAAIAGLPPQYGLYTAMVPAIIAALFGSSHHLISGPTTAISIVVFATLFPLAEPATQPFIVLAFTLSLIAGLFQLALGLARLGRLVRFVSHSVVVGFTSGAAILIASSQMKHLVGVHLPKEGSFVDSWNHLFQLSSQFNFYVLSVGLVTFVSAIIIKKYFPKLPDMLLAMVVGSLLAHYLGTVEHNISLVGSLPTSFPPLSFPDISLATLRTLSSGAFAIAILGLIEAVSIARSVALQSGQRIDGNQEFIGQGLSNIVGSFFSSYPSSGSFTRSGINFRAGAQTPLSAIFSAFCLIAIVWLVAPWAAHLPMAAMAGIIMRVAYNLIDFHQIKMILKTTKSGTSVLLVTFFSTLFLELAFAIYAGVMLSLVLYLLRTSNPLVVSRVPNPNSLSRTFVTDSTLSECCQLKILRIDGSLYFGSVGHVEELLYQAQSANPKQLNLLIIGSGINFVDLSGAEFLVRKAKRLRDRGGHLFLFDVKDQVCSMFKRSGYIHSIGRDHVFQSKVMAIQTIVNNFLDPERCKQCKNRVFLECPEKGH